MPSIMEYDVCSIQGRRSYQEDEALCAPPLFAVFDGHGGGGASFVASRVFPSHFQEALSKSSAKDSLVETWTETYRNTEKSYGNFDWNHDQQTQAKRSLPNYAHQGREGCTAVAAYVDSTNRRVSVANAGDSRCVLCRRDGTSVALSEDHKPLNKGELKRLTAEGFIVRRERIYKVDARGGIVGGGLNLSRALGDFFYGDGVPYTPDVREHDLNVSQDEFLLLASDGLWDVFNNDRACEEARHGAQSLVHKAYGEGSADNITAIIVQLSSNNSFLKESRN